MECKRCGNKEKSWFAYDPYHRNYYCRKCIAFGRINADEELKEIHYETSKRNCHYELKYPLTSAQQQAAAKIRQLQNEKKDILIYAACGAGKTEIVMDSIMRYINAGKKVGFAISRRQVVLEIQARMAQAFPMLHVIAVCEGHHEESDGDLIICTMHQLYRYVHTFDLLIMDEIDAFPYRGNQLLETIAAHACKGQRLYLTATPDEKMLKQTETGELRIVELFQRPHAHPLAAPRVIHTYASMQLLYLVRFLFRCRKAEIQVLVFVPTIKDAKRYARWLRLLFRCTDLTSQTDAKDQILADFHKHKYDCLITTTVLERGITIKGIYVAVLHADHIVFNEASLIQIVGRVGRNIEMPSGEAILLCQRMTSDIKRCIRAIQKMNETLPQSHTVKLGVRR